MKIAFAKTSRSPKEFRFSKEGAEFSGTLEREEAHRVHLLGKIEGEIALECDRCGAEYRERVALPLDLRLSDRILTLEEDLDIIEILDGTIDMEWLLESEIASYRSTYHYCPQCRVNDRKVDIEY
ncbi:YceD family protein [Nitratifractor sp.]